MHPSDDNKTTDVAELHQEINKGRRRSLFILLTIVSIVLGIVSFFVMNVAENNVIHLIATIAFSTFSGCLIIAIFRFFLSEYPDFLSLSTKTKLIAGFFVF